MPSVVGYGLHLAISASQSTARSIAKPRGASARRRAPATASRPGPTRRGGQATSRRARWGRLPRARSARRRSRRSRPTGHRRRGPARPRARRCRSARTDPGRTARLPHPQLPARAWGRGHHVHPTVEQQKPCEQPAPGSDIAVEEQPGQADDQADADPEWQEFGQRLQRFSPTFASTVIPGHHDSERSAKRVAAPVAQALRRVARRPSIASRSPTSPAPRNRS